MNGTLNSIMKRAAVGILIFIMGVLLINKALFTHTHFSANGTLVTHAHPFDKSNESESGNPHQHSELELLVFQNFELLFFVIIVFIAFSNLVKKGEKVFSVLPGFTPSFIIPESGRAPPRF